ncbi:phosphoglycolate phosphatase 1A [Citrus sinensis]|nr:phosphoglycolate phosphatase 1A [Citrus sinensis]
MVTSETFLKMIHWKNVVGKKLKKAVLDVLERFNKVDKWRRASWFFLALAWIVKSVAYLNSLRSHYSTIYFVLIQCPMVFLLFAALFLMLYLRQSVLFVCIVQHHPRSGFLVHMGAVILQEIIYRRIHNNPSSIFSFAFLQSVLVLQYTSYSGLNHGLIPADFRGKREEIVQVVVHLQLFLLLVRTIFDGRFLETGVLMIPFLIGIFAVLHLKNVARQSVVDQIQSPQDQVSDSNGDEANNLEAKQEEECAEANESEAKEEGAEACELEAKEEEQEGAETSELEAKEEVADEAKEEGADEANIEEKQEEDSFVFVESSDTLLYASDNDVVAVEFDSLVFGGKNSSFNADGLKKSRSCSRMESFVTKASASAQPLKNADELIDSVETFIFDCDGVIWKGDKLIDGVPETLDMLRSKGKRLVFVTNNSTKSRKQYGKKFETLGLTVTEVKDSFLSIVCLKFHRIPSPNSSEFSQEEIFASSFAAAAYLKSIDFPKDKKVYVVGEDGILKELELAGFQYLGGPEDGGKKIELKPGFLMEHDKDVKFFLSCLLFLCSGLLYLGGGSMVGAFVGSTQREPLVLIGYRITDSSLMDLINNRFGIQKSQICMVGDRLDTDILFGQNGGCKTLLVLSGVTSLSMLQSPNNSIQPDFYTNKISDFLSLKAAAV